MSERLGEIINDITFVAKSYNGVELLIEYAKEQAERVEELKEIITERHETVGDWIRKYNSLEGKNRRYREALKFYANKDNYEPFGDIMRGHIVVLVHQDKGAHAREALESESDD